MKVTITAVPAPPPPPIETLTISMTRREAELLRMIASFDMTVPETIANGAWRKARQPLHDLCLSLAAALDHEGVAVGPQEFRDVWSF
jgi:hypothetical protein